MANISLVLFRDGRTPSADAVAILRDVVRSGAGRYSLTEIDVKDRPALAAQYNVMMTPTILLMQGCDIVDRIVGTPTTSLVHDLLDTRTVHIGQAAAKRAKAS
jgi:thioredoxin-like negative regulator of GroEL